jgi:hypothetical protein
LGHFSPFPPNPLSPPPPSLLGRTCSALFSDFVEEKTEAIIRRTAFFLVEIKIAIQRVSQYCFHVQVYYNLN